MLSTDIEPPMLTVYGTESDAVDAWANAIVTYFKKAGGIIPASVDGQLSAVKGALAGMSVSGAGTAKIQAGFLIIWTAMVAAPASFFATAIAVTPAPGSTGIAAAILAVVPLNMPPNNPTRAQAASTVAGAIHPCNLGGTWTPPVGPPVPIV